MTVEFDTDVAGYVDEAFGNEELEALGAEVSTKDDDNKQVGWFPYDTIESLARPVIEESKTAEGVEGAKASLLSRGAAHIKNLLAGRAFAGPAQLPDPLAVGASNAPSQGKVMSDQLQMNPWALEAGDTQAISKDIRALSVQATSADDSLLDAAVDEICDWAAWLWNSVNPWSSTDNEEHVDTEIGRKNSDGSTNPFATNRRTLTSAEREDFRKQVAEMNRLFDKLRELLDDDQFEAVMHLILAESQRSRREGGMVVQDQMVDSYKKKARFNKERLKEAEVFVKAAQRSQWWGKFEDFASTMGLGLAAAATVGYSGWGVVALVYLAGMGFNKWQGDVVEHSASKTFSSAVHSLFGWNKRKSEGTAFTILKIGGGVMNVLISIPFASVHWLGTVMEGAMTLVNVHVKRTTDHAQGRLYNITYELQNVQKGVTGHVKKFGDIARAEMDDKKMAAKILQNEEDEIKEIMQQMSGK